MKTNSRWITVPLKLYHYLLWAYPRIHRDAYGSLMTQLFRDQCRDAFREERSVGLAKLWLRLLPDLVKTSLIEHVVEIKRKDMKIKPGSAAFLITGIVAGIISLSLSSVSAVCFAFMALSALAILGRALAEVFRPSNQWAKSLLGAVIVLVVFGFFIPAWAHIQPVKGPLAMAIPPLVGGIVFLNPIVAVLKGVQFLVEKPKA